MMTGLLMYVLAGLLVDLGCRWAYNKNHPGRYFRVRVSLLIVIAWPFWLVYGAWAVLTGRG